MPKKRYFPPWNAPDRNYPPLKFARGTWSSMAHRSVSRVPREGCDVKSRSGSPHMAAPPWRARNQPTLHWYSQGGCDHQWPIGQSPESSGKAAMSRAGVALLTWQPPPDVLGTDRPPIGIHTRAVIINGPSVSLQSPQGRLRCLEPEWLSSHGSPPPDVLGTNRPPIDIRRGLWSSMAHRSLSRVPREGCDV